MSSPRNRLWLLPVLLLASQAWALGLGDIRLESALNEPLRAEIELLAATPEELNNLTIQLASAETFSRYDLDRPLFLTRIDFTIVRSGRADGNFIRVRSREPITEPFVTFLVEAAWSRGRLLREYTVLLDPPTFAPPPVQPQAETVTAPTRTAPADSGQIERQPPPAPARQTPPPSPAVQAPVEPATSPSTERPAPAPTPTPVAQDNSGSASFDTRPGGDVVVQRGDTLWGIASRMRPDSRLTMNQTMLAIYQANPQAFASNINVLRAGAALRIPSADEIFRISRGDALAEVQRQNASWSGGVAPGLPAADPQPSLTLVPPDDEDDLPTVDSSVTPSVDDSAVDDVDVFVDPVEQRIAEIEATLDDPQALLSIENNDLDALRRELAELRGEELPDVDDAIDEVLDDDVFVDEDAVDADDEVAADDDGVMADTGTPDEIVEPVQDTPAVPTVTRPADTEGGIVDTILGYLGNIWVIIGSALALAVLVLVWFMRRSPGGGDEDITGVWSALDADDMETDAESISSTERLRAMAQDDDTSIVVVEQDRSADPTSSMEAIDPLQDLEPGEGLRTVETPTMPSADATTEIPAVTPEPQPGASLEDTFSSETAINLDQSDPVAEADFHMAYGLYDQAADLINGALEAEPGRQDLLAKLCEIYFVWGNRDAFIDAAGRTKAAIGAEGGADWDKIVIMGQQIAADHELFSGVSAEGATKAMDLSFEEGGGDAGALDIDFAGGPDGAVSDVIDLGADTDDVGDETGQVLISPDAGGDIDFSFDEEVDLDASATREMAGPADEAEDEPTAEIAAVDEATSEMPAADESTSEMPAADEATSEIPAADSTSETPTIEQQFENLEATGEMPAISDTPAAPATDATAEIDLDDLGLDLDGLDDAVGANDFADLDDTAESQTLHMADDLEATGKNPTISDVDSLAATGKNLEVDLDIGDDTDVGIDSNLLDATGQTQILTEDMAVETGRHRVDEIGDDDKTELASLDDTIGTDEPTTALADDAETLLASLDDDDEEEFDFAKTEALPKDAFSGDMSGDATGEMPGLAGSTDLDLDLDDLTAALKVSEIGDTVSQPRDDATVEQPRLRSGQGADSAATQSLAPEDISGDLHEARTMTEVGTKLDLARAYVDMGDPSGARSILEEVLDEGDDAQKQQAQQLLDSLPS